MRLGVLDVGSNTVHLLVVDAHPGARPWPASSHKTELRLAEGLTADGLISADGARRLCEFVAEAVEVSEDQGCEDLVSFATSAIRDAPNSDDVLRGVEEATGVRLEVLAGEDEARLTFLAARRWFGWSVGRLLNLDIGGGSLEITVGTDENPDVALSLDLGAGRLARDHLDDDPPAPEQVRALRKLVRARIAVHGIDIAKAGAPDRFVGTSKTFRSLARVCGAAPSSEGPYTPRFLRRDDLAEWLPRLATMTAAQRTKLPGVSAARAPQLLAGALVAEAAMDLVSADVLQICPWALREGIILRRLDWISAG